MIVAPKRGPSLLDLLLIVLTFITVGYYIIEFPDLQRRAGAYNQTDFLIGSIGLFIALEVSRRVLG
jgi:TRAP-type uncharacterized transport system fused permease subunit